MWWLPELDGQTREGRGGEPVPDVQRVIRYSPPAQTGKAGGDHALSIWTEAFRLPS
jgi:hypothetical protein